MKTPIHRFGIVMGIAVVSCLSGCSADYYRAETRLHSDGQIDRAIYQPASTVPEKARRADVWDNTRGAYRIKRGDWSDRIADTSEWTDDEEAPYFAGWNRFASVDEIPDHFVAQSPDESRQGRLVRETKRIDLVFLTEHHWHETLTDIVTIDDMHIASRELADLYTSYIDDVLTEGLGDDYDHKPLISWMKGEGKQWFIELADVYFEAGALKLLNNGGGKEGEAIWNRRCSTRIKIARQSSGRKICHGEIARTVTPQGRHSRRCRNR